MELSHSEKSRGADGCPLAPPGQVSNNTDLQPVVRPEVVRLLNNPMRSYKNLFSGWTQTWLQKSWVQIFGLVQVKILDLGYSPDFVTESWVQGSDLSRGTCQVLNQIQDWGPCHGFYQSREVLHSDPSPGCYSPEGDWF